MTIEELNLWSRYHAAKLLPLRRLEFYLAQLTLHVSALGMAWGGPKYNFSDFLFDEHYKKAARGQTAEDAAPVLGAMGNVRVVRLGQGRKKRG